MSKKEFFNQNSLARILVKVPRETSIGAITKSELFKKDNLDQILDLVFSLIPIPNFVLVILGTVFPDLLDDLQVNLKKILQQYFDTGDVPDITLTFRDVYEPDPKPDETPGIYYEELVEEEYEEVLLTQEVFDKLVEDYKILLEDYNKILEDYNNDKDSETGAGIVSEPEKIKSDIPAIIDYIQNEIYGSDYSNLTTISGDPDGQLAFWYRQGALDFVSDVTRYLRTLI